METREIKITLETARRLYEQGGEMKDIALCAFTEQEIVGDRLPKTWDEFCINNPIGACETYIGNCSEIWFLGKKRRDNLRDKNALPSKKTAKAHLALMQLHQLRDCYRQGWKPDWEDNNKKYYIGHYDNSNHCRVYQESFPNFLSFQTEELADEFLNNFRELIEQAGDLI